MSIFTFWVYYYLFVSICIYVYLNLASIFIYCVYLSLLCLSFSTVSIFIYCVYLSTLPEGGASQRLFLRRGRCLPARIEHCERSARTREVTPLPSSTPSTNKKYQLIFCFNVMCATCMDGHKKNYSIIESTV